jgi:polyhydroxyalkanoate synthesis regulator phasin
MMNTGPMTKVSLLLGTIICLGAFFLIDNNIPVQALHKEEQILEDYDDLSEFANAVRNGDEDLEEIPIQSMEAADIYDDADDNMKDCIDLAAKVGDSLTDREVIHCVDDVGYFETKYSSNSTVPANATFATSTDTSETDVDTATDTTSTSDTSDTSTSDTSDTSTSDTSDTSTSDTSDTSTSDTSDTSTSDTSDTSTSDDVTGNSLINELVNTGKFTEDEAKEFVSQNMLSAADTTSTSDDTSSNTNTDDTQATGTDDTQATGTDDTSSSTNTDDTQATSDSNNNGNPEDYDSLSELVDDIKNRVVDTDEISLSDFQNSGAYQGADEQTQDCIDLAAKIGSNLIDYEIVRCSEDPNHFKNQIANNDNNNAESSDDNNDNNNNESDDDTV